MKYILLIVFAAALAACGVSKPRDDEKAIRIAYLPITHSAAVMLMGEMDFGEDAPFRVELVRFTSWPEVVDALRSRRVDGASILFEVALRAQETDASLVMLGLSHRDGNVVVVDNSILSYRDLIGKTVAIPHRLSPQNTLLNIALEREGIAIDQINIIELSPAEMPFTMASGTISAYIVAEPYGSVAESTGAGRILEMSNSIYPDAACCVLVFNRVFLDAEEGAAEWLKEVFNLASREACSNKEEVARIFRKKTSFNDIVINNSIYNTTYDRLDLTEDEYNAITEIIMRYGVLPSVPTFGGFLLRMP
jgi:NitT/TauT family transport system substrate-binding protein